MTLEAPEGSVTVCCFLAAEGWGRVLMPTEGESEPGTGLWALGSRTWGSAGETMGRRWEADWMGRPGGLDTTGTRGEGLVSGCPGAQRPLGPTSSPGLPASNKHAAVRPQEEFGCAGLRPWGPGVPRWDEV